MVFRLSTAPAVFQNLIKVVLEGLEEYATAYLDYIIIFSKDKGDQQKHIRSMFEKLKKVQIKARAKEISF